jgi:hypothetical protein
MIGKFNKATPVRVYAHSGDFGNPHGRAYLQRQGQAGLSHYVQLTYSEGMTPEEIGLFNDFLNDSLHQAGLL